MLRIPPLKSKRGKRGVMKTVEVTPFNPPHSKGEIQGKREFWHFEIWICLEIGFGDRNSACPASDYILTLPMSFSTSFWSLQKSSRLWPVMIPLR